MASNIFSPSELNAALRSAIPSVWRFALVLTRNRDQADDLLQATCLRAIEKREQFDRDGNFRAWCVTICRSIWLNQLRAEKVRQSQSIDAVPEEALKSLAPDAETNFFSREVFLNIMALPEAQRETVILVYAEGYRYSEAARILEVPVGTIMSRLSAARGKLKWMRSDVEERQGNG